MIDPDPTKTANQEEFWKCLQRLYIHAGEPSLRDLEKRTVHAGGQLPDTRLERVRLGRSTLSKVLRGEHFPSKAFLLTFVEVCGIDLQSDHRWAKSWDRLTIQRKLEPEHRAEVAQTRVDKATAALRANEAPLSQGRQKVQPAIVGIQRAGADSRVGQALARQPSGAARTSPEAARAIRVRGTRLLMDVARAVHSLTSWEHEKAVALASLARAAAATDPDRAERIAQSITDEHEKAVALASLARAAAATDPDRAERIAQSITEQNSKTVTLARIAEAVAASDPDRAARLATDAEKAAQSIPFTDEEAAALASLAQAMTATDPDRAERIAQSITDRFLGVGKSPKAVALASLAQAAAATDPDRAERIARSITDEHEKAVALASLAQAMTATDPDRAERLISDAEKVIRSVYSDGEAAVLASLAQAAAATDPDRAERLATEAEKAAQRMSEEQRDQKAFVLASLAQAVAATDPARAAWFVTDAVGAAQSITKSRREGVGPGQARAGGGRHRHRVRRAHRPVDR